MKSKHTPGPVLFLRDTLVGPSKSIFYLDTNNPKPTKYPPEFVAHGLSAEDTKFLARAWSCHDELLAVLEQATVMMEQHGGFADMVSLARAALSRAGGN